MVIFIDEDVARNEVGGNRKGQNHGVQFHNQVPRHNSAPSFKNVNRHKGKAHMNNAPRNTEGACHRCVARGIGRVLVVPKTSGGSVSSLPQGEGCRD